MKVKVTLLSRVRLFVTPWTVAYQDPPSREFPPWSPHELLALGQPSHHAVRILQQPT